MDNSSMEFRSIKCHIPDGCNIILGHTHFIKTIEDLYEIIVTAVPQARFGIAFCEASGPCLVRVEGNDEELKREVAENAMNIGAGHIFVILTRDAYPINILNAIKHCQEVCTIHCATANPVEVIVVETEERRGVVGVVDGFSPKGIEGDEDRRKRKEFLRKIGYKL